MRGISHVILHLAAPLQHSGPLVSTTVAGGSAIVNLQHGIPCSREQLRFGIEFPTIGDAEWSPMWQHHHRQVLSGTVGHRQIAKQQHAIAGLEMERLHLCHRLRIEPIASAD